MDFYLTQNGSQRGPFRVFQVKEMLDRGEASGADLGWHSGLSGWRPLRDIDAIAPYLPESERSSVEATDEIELAEEESTAPADPMPVQPATAPAAAPALPPARPRPAGTETKWHLFGMRALPRFLARCFDSMLWFAIVCTAGAATGLLPASAFVFPVLVSFWFVPLQSLAWVFLEAWLLARFGTTPGKWLFNLHVRDQEGALPGYMAALKRGFFIWVFAWGLGHSHWALFGSLISLMLFLQHGRMVWDHLVGTEVIHGRARPAAWAVFAAALGTYLAVRFLLFLSQPLPPSMPAEMKAIYEQQRAAFREAYRQGRPSPTPRFE